MFVLNFDIAWPWSKAQPGYGKHYFDREWQLFKNKSLEIQFSRWEIAKYLVSLKVDARWSGEDHAGPRLSIQIWRYYFDIQLYDHKHWNFDQARWYTEQEEQEQDQEQTESDDRRAKYHYEQYLNHLASGNHDLYRKQ